MSIPYATLFNLAPIPILAFHQVTLRFMAVNAAAIEQYGYTREEFLALDCLTIRPEEDRARWVEAYKKGIPTHPVPNVWRHLRKDGTIMDVKVTAHAFEFNEMPIVVAFVRDISEQTRAEQLARTAQERYRRVVASNMVGIICWDVAGNVLEANDAFLSIVGYTRQDLSERKVNWLALTPVEFHPLERKAFEELDERGVCNPFEKEYIRKDGSRVPVMVGGAYLENSRETGVCFVVDMSEHKRLDLRLQQAIQARDEFLSIASHELKTPLTPLQNLLELLVKRARSGNLPSVPEMIKMLESADHQIKRLVKLVHSLLDVSRIHTGKLQLHTESLDLAQLVRSSVEEMLNQLLEAECPISLDLDSTVTGRWDRLRLEQVIANLISNVCKYAPHAPVEVDLKSQGSNVRLSVRDHGPGIAGELRKKIFDRFERGASRPGTVGFGLGLFISKQIVIAHGGRIWVESPPDGGSTFIVDLPRDPAFK
jgi:PAS domain S-box-containing protein